MNSSPKWSPSSDRCGAGKRPSAPPGVTVWRNGARSRARLVVELHGRKVLAPRVVRLLGEIAQQGSVRRAALALGIGYRHAIAWIHDVESLLDCQLVVRRVGGVAGGGAGLTARGATLVRKYEELERALARVAARAERVLKCSGRR